MWPVFAILIAVNILSVIVLAMIAFAVGSDSAPQPPDTGDSRSMRLARTEAPQSEKPPRAEIPPEYRPVDPTPKPWIVLPDGSVRLTRPD